jgi:uncharacterized surface protein with fasciclin (FAS1) repeats
MFQRSTISFLNHMKLHTRKTARQYSAEYGNTWTKEITPRTQQDIQLYGWYHNYPYHNQNDLTWWADRKRPRFTIASYALKEGPYSIFSSLLKMHEVSVIQKLSIGGGKTLFLPTDRAFSDPAIVDELKSDPQKAYQFLRKYVTKGEMNVRMIASRCRQSKSGTIGIKTMGGSVIPIRVVGSLESGNREILIGNGKVVHHGIRCSNGVVFVLDSLI